MVTVFHPSQAPAVIQRRNYLHTATQAEIFFFVKNPTGGKSTYVAGKKKITFPPFLGSSKIERKNKSLHHSQFPLLLKFFQVREPKVRIYKLKDTWINHCRLRV